MELFPYTCTCRECVTYFYLKIWVKKFSEALREFLKAIVRTSSKGYLLVISKSKCFSDNMYIKWTKVWKPVEKPLYYNHRKTPSVKFLKTNKCKSAGSLMVLSWQLTWIWPMYQSVPTITIPLANMATIHRNFCIGGMDLTRPEYLT